MESEILKQSCHGITPGSKMLIDFETEGYFSKKGKYVMAACNSKGQWSQTPVLLLLSCVLMNPQQ